MLAVDRAADLPALLIGVGTSVVGAVFAASGDSVSTGIVIGSAGLLGLMFRSWFAESKRNTAETWNIADEHKIERDYYRALAEHWQQRWVALVQGHDELPDPPPNLDDMKATARAEKENARGKRR